MGTTKFGWHKKLEGNAPECPHGYRPAVAQWFPSAVPRELLYVPNRDGVNQFFLRKMLGIRYGPIGNRFLSF